MHSTIPKLPNFLNPNLQAFKHRSRCTSWLPDRKLEEMFFLELRLKFHGTRLRIIFHNYTEHLSPA